MTSFSKHNLSQSANGRQIKLAASVTPGTLIHTATSGTTNWDEVWLWAVNSSASLTKLTVEFGGSTVPDDTIEVSIPAEGGLTLVVPGLVLQNELEVRAFAGASDVILVSGFVNRITA